MTLESILTMVIILGGVWGGFAFLLVRAIRSEKKLSGEE